MWTIACDEWGDKSKDTALFWRKRLSRHMDAEEFQVVATRLLERENWWPTIEDFVNEIRTLRRAVRLRREHAVLRERALREKQRIAAEGREMFKDALAAGKSIAEALEDGELDFSRMREIIECHDRQLAPAEEQRRISAGRFDEEGDDAEG